MPRSLTYSVHSPELGLLPRVRSVRSYRPGLVTKAVGDEGIFGGLTLGRADSKMSGFMTNRRKELRATLCFVHELLLMYEYAPEIPYFRRVISASTE